VAFGIPWTYKEFMEQACRVGHPALREGGVPKELMVVMDKHAQWTDMIAYRVAWCRNWVARAKELEGAEREDALKRRPEVARLAKGRGFC